MARAQRLSVDQRRARLLDLGVELFSQRTFDQVSTDEIALAGGVSKGLLYHYFASKRGYYVATVRELVERIEVATQLEEGASLEQATRRALRAFAELVRDNSTFYRTLTRGGVDEEIQRIIEDARRELVRRVLERAGLREATPVQRVAFFGWAGFTESACLHWLEHEPELPVEELVEMILGALLLLVAQPAPQTDASH